MLRHFQDISIHFVQVESDDDSYKVKVKDFSGLSQQMFKLKRKVLTFPNCFCRRFSPSLFSSIGTGTCWQLSYTNTHLHPLTHFLSVSTLTHAHFLSLSLTHTHTHTLSLSRIHALSLALSHTFLTFLSLTHTHTHSHKLSLSVSLSLSLTHMYNSQKKIAKWWQDEDNENLGASNSFKNLVTSVSEVKIVNFYCKVIWDLGLLFWTMSQFHRYFTGWYFV